MLNITREGAFDTITGEGAFDATGRGLSALKVPQGPINLSRPEP